MHVLSAVKINRKLQSWCLRAYVSLECLKTFKLSFLLTSVLFLSSPLLLFFVLSFLLSFFLYVCLCLCLPLVLPCTTIITSIHWTSLQTSTCTVCGSAVLLSSSNDNGKPPMHSLTFILSHHSWTMMRWHVCVCVCVCERERERERATNTKREVKSSQVSFIYITQYHKSQICLKGFTIWFISNYQHPVLFYVTHWRHQDTPPVSLCSRNKHQLSRKAALGYCMACNAASVLHFKVLVVENNLLSHVTPLFMYLILKHFCLEICP